MHTQIKSQLSGLVAQREFVDLAQIKRGDNWLLSFGKSVNYFKYKTNKQFIRGISLFGSLYFVKVDKDTINKLKLPKNINWTKIVYIGQCDLKGWLSKKIVDQAMTNTLTCMMNDIRTYMFKQLNIPATTKK